MLNKHGGTGNYPSQQVGKMFRDYYCKIIDPRVDILFHLSLFRKDLKLKESFLGLFVTSSLKLCVSNKQTYYIKIQKIFGTVQYQTVNNLSNT